MDNLDRMRVRAIYANNDRQHDRMVQGKNKTLQRALLYSYQSAWIKKDNDPEEIWFRALINPDKVKFDYDEKIISAEFVHGLEPGDSFEWRGTNTHWIILQRELTELAYFRGNIRRCQLLSSTDPETKEKFELWAAIRGPVETKIDTIQKAGIAVDVPNLTLNIYMKKTDQTMRSFDRYCRFEFMGKFWKVNATDWISTPGILEINAEEDYECHGDETLVEIVPPVEDNAIQGETFTKPLNSYTYKVDHTTIEDEWSVALSAEKNKEVKDVLKWKISDDGSSINVTWTAMTSGSYVLSYGESSKTVIVESLF